MPVRTEAPGCCCDYPLEQIPFSCSGSLLTGTGSQPGNPRGVQPRGSGRYIEERSNRTNLLHKSGPCHAEAALDSPFPLGPKLPMW